MIYGLIPVGGKGQRLGLPFSKEMLPQKGFDFYSPILHHLVEKMQQSGAHKIVFVHGKDFKKDIKNHYSHPCYLHIKQDEPSFSGCLLDFVKQVSLSDFDAVLFGLPDSIFEGNPFPEMLGKMTGIVCGMFRTLPTSKVDRLIIEEDDFAVKSIKTDKNSDWFWGVLKFDGGDIQRMWSQGLFEKHHEIGDILNYYPRSYVYGGSYIDLGTWENLNEYWNRTNG